MRSCQPRHSAAVFVVAACYLTVNTFLKLPKESTVGLLLLALGIPVYVYFAFIARRPNIAPARRSPASR